VGVCQKSKNGEPRDKDGEQWHLEKIVVICGFYVSLLLEVSILNALVHFPSSPYMP